MNTLDTLVAKLKARGTDVTPEQAEAMAVRLEGSVDAYLARLAANDAAVDDYRPLAGEPSDKFSQDMGYELEDPTASGLPDQSP